MQNWDLARMPYVHIFHSLTSTYRVLGTKACSHALREPIPYWGQKIEQS